MLPSLPSIPSRLGIRPPTPSRPGHVFGSLPTTATERVPLRSAANSDTESPGDNAITSDTGPASSAPAADPRERVPSSGTSLEKEISARSLMTPMPPLATPANNAESTTGDLTPQTDVDGVQLDLPLDNPNAGNGTGPDEGAGENHDAWPTSEPIFLATNRITGPALLSFATVRAAQQAPTGQIMGDFLVSGQLSVMLGAPGIGKSLLGIRHGVGLAAGVGWAGDVPAEPRRVIVVCPEDSPYEIRKRIDAAILTSGADPELVSRNLTVLDTAGAFKVATRVGRDGRTVPPEARRLFELAKRAAVGLVCLDPLIELHDLNENDNGDMHFVAATLRDFAQYARCAVLITHHVGKIEGGKITLQSARGASALGGAVRAARGLSELSSDELKSLGIEAGDAHAYFKVGSLKSSYAPPSKVPTYYQRVSTPVDGGTAPGLVHCTPGRARR